MSCAQAPVKNMDLSTYFCISMRQTPLANQTPSNNVSTTGGPMSSANMKIASRYDSLEKCFWAKVNA